MRGVHCPTKRPALVNEAEATVVARRAHKPVQIMRCPHCGWLHVVGIGSPLEQPSKPRPSRRRRSY